MEDLTKVKQLLLQLRGQSQQEVLKYLSKSIDLTSDEKNLVFAYLFPRELRDKELPERILGSRSHPSGSIHPSFIESLLLIEAGKTKQYSRFIKHLFHSFSKVENIHSIEGSEIRTCSVCGKEIYEHTLWKNFSKQYKPEEEKEKLYLAYGSLETDLPICIPCLINLRRSIEILTEIDPSFLDWTLRK